VADDPQQPDPQQPPPQPPPVSFGAPGTPHPAGPAPQYQGYPGGAPGAQYPGAAYPGAPYPGAPYPGAPYPGAPYPGGAYPGTPFPGAQYPGAQYPGAPYPGGPEHPERKRSSLRWIVGGTAATVVVLVAVVVGYLLLRDPSGASGGSATMAHSIRVASPEVITKAGSHEPKVVLSLYEDFLCPHCGSLEDALGPTIDRLIDTGAVAVDYHPVAILDSMADQYSSRAGNAAFCVAQADTSPGKDVFREFRASLFEHQPVELSGEAPTDLQLSAQARLAGAPADVDDCIMDGSYLTVVRGTAAEAGIDGTPTMRLNGTDVDLHGTDGGFLSPQQLIDQVEAVVGDVPGL